MPELPEVETVMRGLEKAMKGKRIEGVTLSRKNLRIPFPPQLSKLRDVRVTGLSRRAKYILIGLDDGRSLLVHLGMSGRMTIGSGKPEKHDHMVITLRDGGRIVFNDARRFGLVDLVKTTALKDHKFLKHLGPEPLEKGFSPAYLAGEIANRKTAIKIAVMDQRIVVGVGNIYASEALYMAGIDPQRAAGSLTAAETGKLVKAIQSVLKKAIRAGGSSLRDYVQADGELGYFQHQWSVYDKTGQSCPSCKKPCIIRITQGQRSTFYCPVKQK